MFLSPFYISSSNEVLADKVSARGLKWGVLTGNLPPGALILMPHESGWHPMWANQYPRAPRQEEGLIMRPHECHPMGFANKPG